MKTVTSILRSALVCALLGIVSLGFTTQSAKALPNATLVPIGGCCFEVHYWIPNFEVNRWVSCRIIPNPGTVQSAGPNFGFATTPTPNLVVTFTHPAGTGFFPFGANINMGVVCFNLIGPSVVTIRFTDRFGMVVNIPFQINCGLIGGGGPIAPVGGSISTDGSVQTSDGISLASSTESITDNQLADITPNPTSDNATVSLALANDMDNVSLYVADMTGRKMLDITTGERLTMGTHSFSVETQNLTSGVYYVVVKSGQFTQAKMLQVIN